MVAQPTSPDATQAPDLQEAARARAASLRTASERAQHLAAAMPRLMMEAGRIAASVQHGLHGRRRAGTGETFWQYRHFLDGEPAARVDWRRSARDDHLYVREREWEAAHTVWLWPDLSASMDYASRGHAPKAERALLLALALAELMVKAGERVGLPEQMAPTASHHIMQRMAQALLLNLRKGQVQESLPPAFAPGPRAEMVLLGDFWTPADETISLIRHFAASGARGHVVQVVDPAEESFPFSGRITFHEPEGGGEIVVGRAESWRETYQLKLEEHRETLRRAAMRAGWSFLIHRTDRPASDLLLALYARLGQPGGAAGNVKEGRT
ncbi:MAG: DUF58 domain-containing protein [Xanthobacter sp.]